MAVWFLVFFSVLSGLASADAQTANVTNNPADKLVAILNSNRTAEKESSLFDNPGLACLALQYIKAYRGDCSEVGGPKAEAPPDAVFAQTFAPNCGVEASSLAPITGRLLGCETKYMQPPEAFSNILVNDNKSLEILYDSNHTEVGAAVSGSDGGSPYFWCVLFSSGETNSSFLLEGGVAKDTRPGCFSGANDDCSGGAGGWSRTPPPVWKFAVGASIALGYALGL
ncbi:uncharacterized protein LOC131335905 [Rhododendron vialii]|uniref:uncharacterized protein LOC131335905 n=1 Tax=Rhododendron vialii TaxID=182163 RepID=UPI00265ECCBA|nr:uncharacterized protein LOC131335905 [Rhododendron vialii]XP_058227455.1 uncharacterized protein LOC131335905 [Rhododendron vialii]